MAYPIEFVRTLNFPKIPEELLPDPTNWDFFELIEQNEDSSQTFLTDEQNRELDKWCKENICDSLYYLFRIQTQGGLSMHKDIGECEGKQTSLTARLYYPVITGGDDVKTCFWEEDKKTLLKEYVLQPKTWYLISGSTYHSISNIPKGKYRLAVTAQVLHEII